MSAPESSRTSQNMNNVHYGESTVNQNEVLRNLERRVRYEPVMDRLGTLGRVISSFTIQAPTEPRGARYVFIETKDAVNLFENAKSVDDAIRRAELMYGSKYDPFVIQQSAHAAGYNLVYMIDFGTEPEQPTYQQQINSSELL